MNSSGNQAIYRVYQFVNYLFWLLNVLLLFRFGLRLVGANPAAAFTDFIYTASSPFVAPFLAVIPSTEVTARSVFEWQTLLAIAVYAVAAIALLRALSFAKPIPKKELEEEKVDRIEER